MKIFPQTLRFLIMRGEKKFFGVCLEFNITEEHEDSEKLAQILKDMAISHIKAVKNNNLDKSLLDRKANKKYFEIWEKLMRREVEQKEVSENMFFSTPTSFIQSHISNPNESKELVLC